MPKSNNDYLNNHKHGEPPRVSAEGRLYALLEEMEHFNASRETGAVTFFRSSECKFCKKHIPKTFQYCSKKCWEDAIRPLGLPSEEKKESEEDPVW